MFQINGKPIALDTPFTLGEGDAAIQYPANFLRLSTAEEKAALGIVEVPDEPVFDSRFYWGPGNPKLLDDREESDAQGNPLYVKVYDAQTETMVDSTERLVTKGLKSQFVAQVKATAGSLLAPTDWKVTRAAEGVKAVDADTLAARAAIRAASDANETAIKACTIVEQLAALQLSWPK